MRAAPEGTEADRGLGWVALAILALVAFPWVIRAALSGPVARTWVTILLSVTVQAVPFLVLGVLVSSVLAALLPAGVLAWNAVRTPVR